MGHDGSIVVLWVYHPDVQSTHAYSVKPRLVGKKAGERGEKYAMVFDSMAHCTQEGAYGTRKPMPAVDKAEVEGIAVEAPNSNGREDPVDLEGWGLAGLLYEAAAAVEAEAEAEGLGTLEDQEVQRNPNRGMPSYMAPVEQMGKCRMDTLDLEGLVVLVVLVAQTVLEVQVLCVLCRDQMALAQRSARRCQHLGMVGILGVVGHVGMGSRYPSVQDNV